MRSAQKEQTAGAQTRDINRPRIEKPGRKGVYGHSWAVVIGIDNYTDPQHGRLQFAVSDAVGIAKLLITQLGFPASKLHLVIDAVSDKVLSQETKAWLEHVRPQLACFEERATKAVIEQLLFTTLPGCTGPDDRVFVYYAGHGTPRRAPGAVVKDAIPYLIPADGVSSHWDTYVELNAVTAQSRFMAAKHVLYMFDACCTGLAGLRAGSQSTSYEQSLLHRKARQCITAATAEGYAADYGRDGHSIFTWHVLRILGGIVRPSQGDLVSTASMISYLKAAVGNEKPHQQIPDGFTLGGHEGGEFVFSAAKAPLTLDERAVLARLLVDEVGRRLDEPSPMELAGELWQSILDTAPAGATEALDARRGQAHAYLLRGQPGGARKLLDDPVLKNDAEAKLLRGLACLRLKEHGVAAQELAAFCAIRPDHPYAAWSRRVADSVLKGRRVALLVGAGKFPNLGHPPLRGCAKDVEAMSDLLRNKLSFDEITVLLDEQATTVGIKAALLAFKTSVQPEDFFLFYFSGNGTLRSGDAVFITYETSPGYRDGLTASEVDGAMKVIPAHDKLLITDGCHLGPLEGSSALGYRHLAGGRRDQNTIELVRARKVSRGAFTLALEHAVRISGNAPIRELWPRIEAELEARQILELQTPTYVGAWDADLVSEDDIALQLVDLAERRTSGRFPAHQVAGFSHWLRQAGSSRALAPFWLGIGSAFLSSRNHEEAIRVLESIEHPDAWLPLVQAYLLSNRHGDAARCWTAQEAGRSAAMAAIGKEHVSELDGLLAQLRDSAGRALLVSVRASTAEAWTDSPLDQLEVVRDALVSRCGFLPERVEVLEDPDRDKLLTAFGELAGGARTAPAFFLFIGPGFNDADIWLSCAKRETGDSHVSVSELHASTPRSEDLTAALFITQTRPPPAGTAPAHDSVHLGTTTIIAAPWRTRDIAEADDEPARRPPNARLPPDVPLLVKMLAAHATPSLSAENWLDLARRPAHAAILGNRGAPLFSSGKARDRALHLLRGIERAPLRRMLPLLTRLAEQPEHAPAAYLQRAIAHAELGLVELARADFEDAMAHQRAAHPAPASPDDDRARARWWAELHYHRGRLWLGERRYSEAETELTLAVKHDPNHVRAHYCRARAIRGLIDADLRDEARRSARRYIQLGAPLGVDDEIEGLITYRATPTEPVARE